MCKRSNARQAISKEEADTKSTPAATFECWTSNNDHGQESKGEYLNKYPSALPSESRIILPSSNKHFAISLRNRNTHKCQKRKLQRSKPQSPRNQLVATDSIPVQSGSSKYDMQLTSLSILQPSTERRRISVAHWRWLSESLVGSIERWTLLVLRKVELVSSAHLRSIIVSKLPYLLWLIEDDFSPNSSASLTQKRTPDPAGKEIQIPRQFNHGNEYAGTGC